MTKTLCWLCVLPALSAVPVLAAPDCPVCEWALKQEWRDADTESAYDAGLCTILQVQVKAATRVLLFDADGCVDGYCVSGIGTSQGRVWEDGPRHDISNVAWCVACPPTAVGLVRVEAGSLWAWAGAIAVIGAVCFGWGWLARHEAQCERERLARLREAVNAALGRKAEREVAQREFESQSG